MKTLWNSAFGLLLVTGCLLGLSLPFGKLATQAGIPALVWSLVISAGGGVVLLIGLLSAGKRFRPGWKQLRYFLVVAVVSYALPNVLMFTVMPHLGAGYTGIMYTLSPIMTLALSALLGVQRPGRYGMAGIAIGFAGAVMVAASRGQAGQPAALIWVAAALLVPVSLAMGNIYRTTNWPKGAGPIELAAGSNLVAAVLPSCCSRAWLRCQAFSLSLFLPRRRSLPLRKRRQRRACLPSSSACSPSEVPSI